VLARHLSALALACALLAALAVPASAQTQQADAVLLARTLADGLTAVDARRPQARATVDAWLAEQGSCAKPELHGRSRRGGFMYLRRQALHAVALRALAPELEQFAQRLRALPVTDPAVRGGVREVLIDYRNARELAAVAGPSLCRIVRAVRGRAPLPAGLAYGGEDARGTLHGVERRGSRLQAAQHALLRVEVDPRLARSLDSVWEHATGRLFRSHLEVRERLAPPFPIVTDAGELARLRAEAHRVAEATGTMLAASRPMGRRLERSLERISRCIPAFEEGADRRPNGLFALVTAWLFGEIAAAAKQPARQFIGDLEAVAVTDPALRALVARTVEQLAWIPKAPRVNLCHELRTWRRAGWKGGAIDLPDDGELIAESWNGIRLDDIVIDEAVLRRRGVGKQAAAVLLSPLDVLLAGVETTPGRSAATGYATRTHTLAARVRAMSAALIARGAWRKPQATSAPASGSAGAR
jgi:hypothetical protein